MEQKIRNIYQRMLDATGDIHRVAKNLDVGEGRNSYKAVGEADVLAAVRKVEREHGIYSYPYSREIVEACVMTKERVYNGTTQKTESQFMRIKTVYRFVNVDKPDEYIEITAYGDGVDPQDKSPGKAQTYSDKYAMLKAYKIMTGDDPDQTMSESGTFSAPKRRTETPGSAYTGKEKERLKEQIVGICGDRAKIEQASARKYGKPFDALTETELRDVLASMKQNEASVNVRSVDGNQNGTETA